MSTVINKKICTFTQTYSNNRQELFYYHNKDICDINFRNQFDTNLYSFHNCSDNYVEDILKQDYFKHLKNLKIARYDNISYPKSFQYTLNWIIQNQYDYIIFLQDDCLTYNSIDNEVIDFIKYQEFNMLNLETTPTDLNVNKEIIYKNKNFKVYNTNSYDFVKKGLYAFDDGAYVAKVDFIVKFLYDNEYFLTTDVWNGEIYLKEKINKFPIQRLTTNKQFYKRYNILGRNNWDRNNLILQLNAKFNNL